MFNRGMMQDAKPILLDALDAGRLLGLSTVRVNRLVRNGVLPHVVLPEGGVRFLECDLIEWVQRYRQPSNVEGPTDG